MLRTRRTRQAMAALISLTLLTAACGDDDDEATTATTATTAADGATTTTGDATTTTAAPPIDISEFCDNSAEDASLSGESADVLRVGYLLPQSGQLDFLGAPMICAVNMAVQELNAAGGINGQPVELIPTDDGTDADIASTAADNLLASGVDVIVGAAASGVSAAVLDKITSEGVPMCSPSNTGLQFTTIDDNGGFYFRTAPPDNLQAQVLSDLIIGDGFQNLVIAARSDEYGEGFAGALEQELSDGGVTVADVILYDQTADTFSDVGEQIAAADPDAVALIAFEEGGAVIQGAIANSVGPQDVQWFGTDGIQSSTFFESVDADDPTQVEGIRGTAPSAAPADGEPTFRDRFSAFAPDVDTIFSGHAYDCVVVAALAAATAGSDVSTDIQAAMNDVTREGEKCTLIAECLELIADGTDIDYDGAAGPLDFIDAGEPGAGAYDTWEFDAEGAVTVLEESIPVAG